MIEKLLKISCTLGAEAINELAATYKGQQSYEKIHSLCEAFKTTKKEAELPFFSELQSQFIQKRASNYLPWQQGEDLAKFARHIWEFKKGPIKEKNLLDLLKISKIHQEEILSLTSRENRIAAGLRDKNHPERFKILMTPTHPISQKFKIARLLGDQIWTTSNERLLPVTEAKTARQKFQRVFASELLCPIDELQEHLGSDDPSDEQIEIAAQHFDVSPLLVKTSLVNKGHINRERLYPHSLYKI